MFGCLRFNSCVCGGGVLPGAGVRGIRTYVTAAGGALEVEHQADVALVEDVLHHNHLSWDGRGCRRNDEVLLVLGLEVLWAAFGISVRVSCIGHGGNGQRPGKLALKQQQRQLLVSWTNRLVIST